MTINKTVTNLSVAELANVSMDIQLGVLSLKLRQLSIQELFGHFEQKIRSQKLKEAQEVASLITDGKSRNDFLISVWKSLPSGTELTDMVSDVMQSIDGISDILSLSSGVDVIEIQKHISFDKLDELAPMVTWVIGVDHNNEEPKKEDLKGEQGEQGDTEKKTM